MTGDTHYDLDALADLAEGLLDAASASRVREHLAVCDPCGELLADLAAVREVLAATPTPAMPMGVALRIDKALAAEAESRRGGVGLVEAPDWDELMRDAPWERPRGVPEPARLGMVSEPEPEPVRLGVVSDDGTVVPAKVRSARRRRWAMPAVAAAAAAAVVGTAAVSTGLLASGGGGGTSARPPVALPSTTSATKSPQKARGYTMTDSGYNYSNSVLRQPLETLFGPMPALGGEDASADKVAKCADKVSDRSGLDVFAVDQGQYNGQEALVFASWKNKAAKKIRIDIVDPFYCKNLRKPTLGRW
ncbi:anti-sigma factor family protein [Nonomuraea polychroma]|uniref:anti-sigma factor family protein n=1 Tax=Nonomuraea polychroma TaxID=46176 RepID=UPI003D927885